MDVLHELVASVRVAGTVYCGFNLKRGWRLTVPERAVASFVALDRGQCRVQVAGVTHRLRSGHLALLPHGQELQLFDRHETPGTLTLGEALQTISPEKPRTVPLGSGSPSGTLICGGFAFDRTAGNPLLAFLPDFVSIRLEPPLRALVDTIRHELSVRQPAGQVVLERLSEALFVQLMRRVQPAELASGLRDEIVSRAVAAVHAEPARDWTLESLAKQAGASRSALTQRFRSRLGTSPGRYLAQWRVLLATTMLRDSTLSVDAVAERVGYESTASFSRLFKRLTGVSPGRYRRDGDVAKRVLYGMGDSV